MPPCAPSLPFPQSLSQAHILSALVLQSSGQEAKVNLKKKKKKVCERPKHSHQEGGAGRGGEAAGGEGELIWGLWWILNPQLTSVVLSHPRGQRHKQQRVPQLKPRMANTL